MEPHQPKVDQAIGAEIMKQRERTGLSRVELAERVAVFESDIAAVETGVCRAGASLLLDIANALAVPVTELLVEPDS